MARAAALAAVVALLALALHFATSERGVTRPIERDDTPTSDDEADVVAPPARLPENRSAIESSGPATSGGSSGDAPADAAAPTDDAPVLVGRLVFENGSPVADTRFQLSIHSADGRRVRSQPTSTNALGRFRFPVLYVEPPHVGLRMTARQHSASIRRWTASIDLPPLVHGAPNDVGDVVVRESAVGVRVRLAVPDGAEIRDEGFVDADLVLWGDDGEHEHDRGDVRRGMVVLEFEDGVQEGWITDRRKRLLFDDGRQSAFLDPTQPGAKARGVGFRTAIRVRAGDDVVLRTVVGGSVEGSVRLPAPGEENPFEGTDARVRLLSSGAPRPGPFGHEVKSSQVMIENLREDGSFELNDVEPGMYRLEVLRGGSLPLATVDPIEVTSGHTTRDQRLVAIELGAHVQRLEVTVVDAVGESVDAPRATVVQGGDIDPFSGRAGRVVLFVSRDLLGGDPARVVVDAQDYVPVELEPPLGDRTVVLQRMETIAVQALAPFEGETQSHGFFFRLRRVDAPEPLADHWCAELPWGWNGETDASIAVPGPGRYELEVKVLQRMGSLLGHTPYDRYVPTGTFVDVGPGIGTVTLEIPRDLLRFKAR